MQRSELKKLIKECMIEILSEDFLKKIINEQITDKIQIDVRMPGISSSRESIHESAEQPKKKELSEEQREKIRKAVIGEDISDLSSLGLNPKVVNAVEKIDNPLFKQLAEDTLKTEASKATEQTSFSPEEAKFLDIKKIQMIENSLESI
jgi:hypothetical protein